MLRIKANETTLGVKADLIFTALLREIECFVGLFYRVVDIPVIVETSQTTADGKSNVRLIRDGDL